MRFRVQEPGPGYGLRIHRPPSDRFDFNIRQLAILIASRLIKLISSQIVHMHIFNSESSRTENVIQ